MTEKQLVQIEVQTQRNIILPCFKFTVDFLFIFVLDIPWFGELLDCVL